MDIDTAQLGQINERLWQELSVGDDNDQVRSKGSQLLQNALLPDLLRLTDRDVMGQRHLLHRRSQKLHAPVFRLIRLGVDCGNFMSVCDQPLQ